jgi:hypothetical protein
MYFVQQYEAVHEKQTIYFTVQVPTFDRNLFHMYVNRIFQLYFMLNLQLDPLWFCIYTA